MCLFKSNVYQVCYLFKYLIVAPKTSGMRVRIKGMVAIGGDNVKLSVGSETKDI